MTRKWSESPSVLSNNPGQAALICRREGLLKFLAKKWLRKKKRGQLSPVPKQ